ncbi:MAG: FAD-binding protein, partial [Thermoanaerobaculia bacterium]
PVPVSPAAHYTMGGVWTDDRGRTSLPALWACGEVAASGVHGANRLASNSLLEALVFGARVARDLADRELRPASRGELRLSAGGDVDRALAEGLTRELRSVMWRHVGLVRDAAGLRLAGRRLAAIERRLPAGSSELHNLLLVGRLVACAALGRRESRGAHYRRDFPQTDEAWRRRLPVVLPVRSPRLRHVAASARTRAR